MNKSYFLYALGRNGECTLNTEAGSAQANKVKVTLVHAESKRRFDQDLYFDAEGKVDLGELKDVQEVNASMQNDSAKVNETWQIGGEGDHVWT